MIHFDINNLENQLKELEKETLKDNFWNDKEYSNEVLKKIKSIKSKCNRYSSILMKIQELIDMSLTTADTN